jgi:membrane protein YqaA with SNARE-associated domain
MAHSVRNVLTAPSRLLRRLYDWTIHWSRTGYATVALFVIAVAEASVFPVPPDVLMIPMVVARPRRWWWTALVCTAGSVIGAVGGWLIGWGLYEAVGEPIVRAYHLEEKMVHVGQRYEENAFLTVVTAAFTPIPFKVITIAAGLFKVSLPMVVFAALVGRAGRFFLVAGLLRLFGERMAALIEKYFDLLAFAFLVLLVGGFFALRYLR